jgi:hypothetical protein
MMGSASKGGNCAVASFAVGVEVFKCFGCIAKGLAGLKITE